MLPSIKESDRFTSEDRVALLNMGVLSTIAVAVNIIAGLLGWIGLKIVLYFVLLAVVGPVFRFAYLLVVGPVSFCQAMCCEFKGIIYLVDTPRNETCPSCGSGPLRNLHGHRHRTSVEWYKEKSSRQREWIPKLHCRKCGYKANRVAATAVRSTRTRAANASRSTRTRAARTKRPRNPSKAKKQQKSQDGKADYATVPVVEPRLLPSPTMLPRVLRYSRTLWWK